MIYGIAAVIVVALIVIGVLVYRRHQDSIEKAVDEGQALVQKGKDKIEEIRK